MRNACLNTLAAAASALSIAASVSANPASMAIPGRAPATSPAPATAPAPAAAPPVYVAQNVPVVQPPVPAVQPVAPVVQDEQPRPSSLISPYKNPIKYFTAAMSELPIGRGKNKEEATAEAGNPVMPPVASDSAPTTTTPAGPASPQQFIVAAQLAEQRGDLHEARQQFGQALALWPSNADVLRAAAGMEDRAGELPLAEHLYRQVVAVSPQQPGPLNNLGLCLARAGKLDEAAHVFEQAIQLQPEKPLYRNNAALVLVELRQDQRALAHLSAVHGAAHANYNLGQLLVQRGRPADAAHYFQAAVEQNPNLQPAHVALARLQGRPAPDTTTPAPTAAQSIVPVANPQQAPTVGPQLYYPASQTPPYGASSYMPPIYHAPTGQSPAAVQPANISGSPRYLPPVATQPGPTRR